MDVANKTEQFAEKLNRLLDGKGVPPINSGRVEWLHHFVTHELGIELSYEACRKWVAGESMPYTKRLAALADGLNTSIEFLIGNKDHGKLLKSNSKINSFPMSLTDDDIELLIKIKNLSPKNRARLLGYMDALFNGYSEKVS